MTRRRVLGVTGLIVVAALAAAAGFGAWQGSRPALLARKGALVAADRGAVSSDVDATIEELTLRSSSGLAVGALLRRPARTPGPHPAAVLVGGINLGRRIALARGLEGIARDAVILAIDYSLQPRRSAWRGVSALGTLARVRPAAFDTIASVLLALDYLESHPDVDRRRLFLVGGSMGAVAVSIAGGIDERPAAVVALYGAGRLGSLVAHALAYPQPRPYPRPVALAAGYGLALLIAPLEPTRYVGRIAPRPFLMVNGSTDTLIPPVNVNALWQAAREPKEVIWVAGEHVQPTEAALLETLGEVVRRWLVGRGLLPPA